MSRQAAKIFLPVVLLLAIGAALFVKPWSHLSAGTGPRLPAAVNAILHDPVPAATTPTNFDTPGTGRILSATQLEASSRPGSPSSP